MSDLSIGEAAPTFNVPRDGGDMVDLASYAGKNVVLYFYPKDDTPGCTKEAIGFTEAMPAFQQINTVVLGVSKDTVAKHEKFRAKYELGIPLLSDVEGAVCDAYGVWVEKSMYGKTYMGIERVTYLIDSMGKISQIWRKVKVPGHVDAVLEAAKAL